MKIAETSYWRTDPLFLSVFPQYMSRDRCFLIMHYLHFSIENEDDHINKSRSVIEYFNKKADEIYYPGKKLSHDETMILLRGRLQFHQYITNER